MNTELSPPLFPRLSRAVGSGAKVEAAASSQDGHASANGARPLVTLPRASQLRKCESAQPSSPDSTLLNA